ncbi:MAG: hypothetical protein AAF193_10050, partial [Bacteroidota bacterium]
MNLTRSLLPIILVAFSLFTHESAAQSLDFVVTQPNLNYRFSQELQSGQQLSLFSDADWGTHYHLFEGADFQSIDLPSDDVIYIAEYQGSHYFYNNDNNTVLYRYNGETVDVLGLPEGNFMGQYWITYQDKMLFKLTDQDFNQHVFAFNGNNFELVNLPEGTRPSLFFTEYQNDLYLTLTNEDFSSELYTYDGSNFALFLPEEEELFGFCFLVDDELYINCYDEDDIFNTELCIWNGSELTTITNPAGYGYNYFVGKNGARRFLGYIDQETLLSDLYVLENGVITAIDAPQPFTTPYFVDNVNESSYFTFNDEGIVESDVFRLDGTQLTQIQRPNSEWVTEFHQGTLGEKVHFFYTDAEGMNHFCEIGLDSEMAVIVEGAPLDDNQYWTWNQVVDDVLHC